LGGDVESSELRVEGTETLLDPRLPTLNSQRKRKLEGTTGSLRPSGLGRIGKSADLGAISVTEGVAN
jgi:hypothetical protein